MQSKATTVTEYLKSLPEDRRKAISALRKVIKANLGTGFKEGMQYGMIGYFVPHSLYPYGYHCAPDQPLPFASLGSQKNHMAFYSFFLYQDAKELARFTKAWKASGNKLDMGKACVRFKKIDDVPLDVIGDAVARQSYDKHIKKYEAALGDRAPSKVAAKKSKQVAKKQAAPKKQAAKKQAATKRPSQKTSKKKAAKKRAR